MALCLLQNLAVVRRVYLQALQEGASHCWIQGFAFACRVLFEEFVRSVRALHKTFLEALEIETRASSGCLEGFGQDFGVYQFGS